MSFNVAVAGATGAVGQEMLNVLKEREFPIKNLKLLASERSEGKKIGFKDALSAVKVLLKYRFSE